MSTLDRLEKWRYANKARYLIIEGTDGYCYDYWRVCLLGEKLHLPEEALLHSDPLYYDAPYGFSVYAFDTDTELPLDKIPINVVYVGDSDRHSYGLDATINKAIDKWEQLVHTYGIKCLS